MAEILNRPSLLFGSTTSLAEMQCIWDTCIFFCRKAGKMAYWHPSKESYLKLVISGTCSWCIEETKKFTGAGIICCS
jgi:hypothetical protein